MLKIIWYLPEKSRKIMYHLSLFSILNKKEKDPALKVVSKNVSVAEVDNTIKGF